MRTLYSRCRKFISTRRPGPSAKPKPTAIIRPYTQAIKDLDKKHEEHLKMVDEIVKYVNVTNGHEITKKLSKEKEKRIMKVLDEWYS